jgi:hypothetical protein
VVDDLAGKDVIDVDVALGHGFVAIEAGAGLIPLEKGDIGRQGGSLVAVFNVNIPRRSLFRCEWSWAI